MDVSNATVVVIAVGGSSLPAFSLFESVLFPLSIVLSSYGETSVPRNAFV